MERKSSNVSNLQSKPPVVVVLGHVDHGKTSLLDCIRKTNVVAKEAGGITQRIGAYQVKLRTQNSELRTITFIDTPGHETFTQMRSRGAKVADLAVLVVAVDDGVMPQTKESIKYIKKAKIPFLVAINKIDLTGASLDKIYGQLAENDVLVENYGGKIVSVPVSAKTGQGIDKLLEMIILLAEMEELKANPGGKFKGVVIESRLDKQKGSLAAMLVQNGTLKIGDQVEIEGLPAKIKAMFDENGKRVARAGPAMPVEILGLKEVPPVGAEVTAAKETPNGKKPPLPKPPKLQSFTKMSTPEDTEKKLKILLKTDTLGSLEAILDSFPDDVLVVHSNVGDINQSDIDLAKTTKTQVFAFNVKIPTEIGKLAQTEKVLIHHYKIIYELLEEIEKQVLKILEPTIDEEILGKAEIIAEFEIKGARIAGAKVIEGKIPRTEKIHLMRNKEIVGSAKIASMKQEKEDITEAKTGQEFGATLSLPLDFKIGDSIISYRK